MKARLSIVSLSLLCASALGVAKLYAEEGRAFKVLIEESGVYEISYDQLKGAGYRMDSAPSAFRMTNRGEEVPLWIQDTDGTFGPGDSIVFLGDRLTGETTYFHPHSSLNVYLLESGATGEAMKVVSAPRDDTSIDSEAYLHSQHLEIDTLLMRFSNRSGTEEQDDGWFWRKLTQIDKKPFRVDLTIPDLDLEGEAVDLRIGLRGWSKAGRVSKLPHHHAQVLLNGTLIGEATWDDQQDKILEVNDLEASLLSGKARIEIRVPKRVPDGAGEPMVDVILVNWIEIDAPRGGRIEAAQESFFLRGGKTEATRYLSTAQQAEVLIFDETGSVFSTTTSPRADGFGHLWQAPQEASRLTTVVNRAFLSPFGIVPRQATDLRSTANQADYLMIADRDLIAAVEPLAEFHRRRGLTVRTVNVAGIYDEFNGGIVDPRAIRDFIAHAYERWEAPRPRFVLLVGDASWDIKNAQPDSRKYADWTYRPGEVRRSARNEITPYQDGQQLDRNLIPTWMYASAQGHAASDNYFVTVDGDDYLPDLAIGRFPVAAASDVEAIVEKTLAYSNSTDVGPWRRRILWITNEETSFQRRTDILAEEMSSRGFGDTKIYPSPEEADNLHHQQALLDALNSGHLLVHFFGHGGRYIWRTGPPDFKKNHDLFTLDHLEDLEPSERLPIVLSMTCYSAPFDHPTADSIGEKFLRLPDRGAVVVLAASWRNSPSQRFSRLIVSGMAEGESIGEAVQTAKRQEKRRDLIETYNLLGDPALLPALPAEAMTLEPVAGGNAVRASLPDNDRIPGQLLVEWVGPSGEIIEERTFAANSTEVVVEGGTSTTQAIAVRAYFWDATSGRDGMGLLDLSPDSNEASDIGASPGTSR